MGDTVEMSKSEARISYLDALASDWNLSVTFEIGRTLANGDVEVRVSGRDAYTFLERWSGADY